MQKSPGFCRGFSRSFSSEFCLGGKALLHDVRVVGQFTRGGIEYHSVEVLRAVVNLEKDVHGELGTLSVVGT